MHGVCVEGACLCEADWFGEECDADVHDMDIYLPPSDPAGTWWACHQVAPARPIAGSTLMDACVLDA